PKDWEALKRNEVVAQWKDLNDEKEHGESGSPPLALRVEEKDWLMTTRWDSRRTSNKEKPQGEEEVFRVPYQRGQWTDWVVHYKASYKRDGLIEVWKDGKLVA